VIVVTQPPLRREMGEERTIPPPHLSSCRIGAILTAMVLVHTADWQLGKPFARIDDPDKAARVRSARIEAIVRIGEIARERGVSCVLVAGDLFDSFTAEKSVVSAACGAVGGIGLPVYAIPGNHDHGGPGCLWEQPFFRAERESLAPNLHVILKREPLDLGEAVLFPCPLLRRHESEDPTEWLRRCDVDAVAGGKPRIVLAHGSVQGFDSGGGDEEEDGPGSPNLVSLERLPAGAFDYVALGDWHGTKEVAPGAWYSGTPETDRFPRGEGNDPGHLLVVEVARGEAPRVEKVRAGSLGWHFLDFEFLGDEDLPRFEVALEEIVAQRTGEDLVNLSLSGKLGIEAASRLETVLERWRARLLRVKERSAVRLAPSESEVAALRERGEDPLVSMVAGRLMELAGSGGPDAEAGDAGSESELARIALRELWTACQEA